MKKSIITILFTIVFLSVLTTLVYGAEPQITINGDGSVKPGESKELTINISSDEEIGIVSGKIGATSNITDMTVTGVNSWNLTYNNSTGEFNIYKAEGAKVQDIITIQYKAGAEEGTGTITLSNIKMTTISYESKEIGTITKDIKIANEQQTNPEPPTGKTLKGINITKAPTKIAYIVGEKFDTTGMEITATYSDGSTKKVTNYTYTPDRFLLTTDSKITITYKENGVEKTVEQKITVNNKEDYNKEETSNKVKEQNKDKTTASEKKLPQTGISNNILVIVLISMIAIIILIYAKYKKYKKI